MFRYFGYGSNINLTALKAKGVEPLSSVKGVLKGWQLCFNVQHWFKHEGGMGNIEKTNHHHHWVEGVLHICKDESLVSLDKLEALGIGYDRIEVPIITDKGIFKAYTYVGLPAFINNSCLPTQRYKNIILKGAAEAGLSKTYIANLKAQKVVDMPQYAPFKNTTVHHAVYNNKDLKEHKHLTALKGYVFDMSSPRKELECLLDIFGGKDMTLFHLKRLDSSTGNETIQDIITNKISREGQNYLNTYLHEYSKEFKCVGRYTYD